MILQDFSFLVKTKFDNTLQTSTMKKGSQENLTDKISINAMNFHILSSLYYILY